MAADASQSIGAFPLAESGDTAIRPSRFEDDVTSLFDQLHAPVLRYLLSFRVSVPDAEEIAQEVFMSLFQHLKQGKSRENLQGWIFKVAHNLALKRRLQARRHSDRFTDAFTFSEPPDLGPGPEETLAASQRQARLLSVVRALPEQDRCCLSLRAEGLRYREIAEVLSISLGSVAASLEKSLSRLSRAEKT